MKAVLRTFLILSLVAVRVASAQTFVIDDGGEHVIADSLGEDVTVLQVADGTSVTITDGAQLPHVDVRRGSTIDLEGGVIATEKVVGVVLSEGAHLQMTGATIRSPNVAIGAIAQTSTDIRGGSIQACRLLALAVESSARIEGVQFDSQCSDVDEIRSELTVESHSDLTIVGSEFNYPMFDPIADLEGTITGMLADGSEFGWSFEREPTATIILVPEPSAISLVMLGVLGLLAYRQRHAIV